MEKVGHERQNPGKRNFTTLLPIYLWVCSFPLGIALQNLMSGLVFLLIMGRLFKTRSVYSLSWLKESGCWPILFSVAMIGWITLATILNPENAASEKILKFPPGYLVFCFFPLLFLITYGKLSTVEWKKILKLTAFVALLWGLTAASQAAFGWRILGADFIFEEARRPRGLYSHPLTLAYAAFFLWPLSVRLLIRDVTCRAGWMMMFGTGIIILLTQSRTVQAVSAFLLFSNLFFCFRGKNRIFFTGMILAAGILFLVTPNQYSSKFVDTFTTKGVDLHSDYPDDRVAFWHAHWLMLKERPVTGHGFQLNTEYRKPYYARIGLSGFKKQYEAHNMYLQIACNGGIIALSLFFVWSLWLLATIHRQSENNFFRLVAFQTFVGFLLISLTQNAFQDASVRMLLSMFITGCWLVTGSRTPGRETPAVT